MFAPINEIDIVVVLEIISSFLVAIGLFFTVYQMRESKLIDKRDYERVKKQSTIEYYTQLSLDTEPCRDLYSEFFTKKRLAKDSKRFTGKKLKEEDVNSIFKPENRKLRLSIRRHLGAFERLATGVLHGIYDEDTLRELSGVFIVSLYENRSLYIDRVRKLRIKKYASQNKRPRNLVYSNFEILVNRYRKSCFLCKDPDDSTTTFE